MYVMIVRRGCSGRFDALQDVARERPMEVIWDRRQGDRRQLDRTVGAQRRQTERRQPPPATWELADFVLML